MQLDPFNNKVRVQNTQKFTQVFSRVMGVSNSDSFTGAIVSVIASLMQILSSGAKILIRRKLGIRAAGRIRLIAHILIIALIFLSSIDGDRRKEEGREFIIGDIPTLDMSEIYIDYNGATERIYLIIYTSLISILGISNFIGFKKRKGKESNSYFRGYSILSSSKTINETTHRSLRLIDPLILLFITWGLSNFLGSSFLTISVILATGSIVLLLEEVLIIYDEINMKLDVNDAKTFVSDNIITQDSSDTGY